MTDAPWMAIARSQLGVKETPGPGTTAQIAAYHADTTLRAKDDETSWCSAFVNWVMDECGIKGTRDAAARSWLNWVDGDRCEPKPGAIAILWRVKPVGWQGHVAFIDRIDGDTLYLLGGNQGAKGEPDQVNIRPFPKSRLLGCRWPRTNLA